MQMRYFLLVFFNHDYICQPFRGLNFENVVFFEKFVSIFWLMANCLSGVNCLRFYLTSFLFGFTFSLCTATNSLTPGISSGDQRKYVS